MRTSAPASPRPYPTAKAKVDDHPPPSPHSLPLGLSRLRSGALRTHKLKYPSVENPELTKVLPSKPRVGQNVATHASRTAKNVFVFCSNICLSGLFTPPPPPPPSPEFSPCFLTVFVLARVGPRNEIGHQLVVTRRFPW